MRNDVILMSLFTSSFTAKTDDVVNTKAKATSKNDFEEHIVGRLLLWLQLLSVRREGGFLYQFGPKLYRESCIIICMVVRLFMYRSSN